jgi:hypothetical protein
MAVDAATWYTVMWDSALTGAAPQGSGALANHYAGGTAPSSYADNNSNPSAETRGICKDLSINGYTDWRPPTEAEATAALNTYTASTNLGWSRSVWTSTTSADASKARLVRAVGGVAAVTEGPKGCYNPSTCTGASVVQINVRCVR